MCDNARINEELTEDTDFSSSCLGRSTNGYRIMFSSGNRKPPRIEIEQYDSNCGWFKIALYYPKFCPNCGREIKEYDSTRSD
jgi:ribosomal protein L33